MDALHCRTRWHADYAPGLAAMSAATSTHAARTRATAGGKVQAVVGSSMAAAQLM